MKIIIFENEDKTIGIVIPDGKILSSVSIEEIAIKDTPCGLPFWIVDESVLPIDRENRDLWELDGTQGEPDGYGNESNKFERVI